MKIIGTWQSAKEKKEKKFHKTALKIFKNVKYNT